MQEERQPPGEAAATDVSWWRIGFICSVLLLEGMSSSSINVQIAALGSSLHLTPIQLQLTASSFLVAYAGLLPAAGRLVDAWDRRAMFMIGVGVFGLGSVLCAVATSGWWLVLGRFVQGAGAAFSAPAAIALITANLPPGRLRNKALALYGSMGAAGFTLGLVVPGFLVTQLGWRASFLVYVPLVVAVLMVTRTIGSAPGTSARVDAVSAVLLTTSVVLAVGTIGSIGETSLWASGGLVAAAAGLAALLVHRGRRREIRMFPADVVRSPRVIVGCVALAGLFAAIVASMYLTGLELALNRGHDEFAVGLALAPQSISNAAVGMWGGRMVTRFGPGRVLASGMALVACALGYLGAVGFHLPYTLGLLPSTLAIGSGVALCYPAASIMAVSAVRPHEHGTTSALLTVFQNVGGAVGLALVTAFGAVPLPGGAQGPERGMYISAACILVAGVVSLTVLSRDARRTRDTPGSTAEPNHKMTAHQES
ncbi:MFS transporter [Streptomyces violascens]|uniref:MFS transporter n=1 Tax=Streptomyces violascens TaxID=67381 RepID=A0ABQ3QWA5_9ACTN|nr:MFS transporter [Streptomyces violascens]GHI41564.1 MFS transporter [Streptomyces violascens]